MKKMNLKFFGRGAKMVLPLFLLIGLFMVSATTLSAQFVPTNVAKEKVDVFISQLEQTPEMFAGMDYPSPKVNKATENVLRRHFGNMVLHQLANDDGVGEALDNAYKRMNAKIPAAKLNPIMQEFEQLLSE